MLIGDTANRIFVNPALIVYSLPSNNDQGRIGESDPEQVRAPCVQSHRFGGFPFFMADCDLPFLGASTTHAIVVMGVSGSGKSTLGSLLSRKFCCPFIEADDFHDPINVEKMRSGIPLTDDDRWPWLDRLGKALRDGLETNAAIVATCSALKIEYRHRLESATGTTIKFVMLEVDQHELLRRVSSRKDHYMPASLLKSQLQTLERPTSDEEALILDATRPPADLANEVEIWLSADLN